MIDQIDETKLRLLIDQANKNGSDWDLYKGIERLYAGLTLLSKDMDEYLAVHPREDSQLFYAVYTDVMNEEISYWNQHGGSPLPLPLKQVQLPAGFTAAAAEGHPNVDALADMNIICEWTVGPGKKLMDRFKAKFKVTICDKDGPYAKFNQGMLGQADLPIAIVNTILLVEFSPATCWYPLAVYMSLLLIKAGLKTYCEP